MESDIAVSGTIHTESGAINVLADNDLVIGGDGVVSSGSGAVKLQADMDGAVDSGGTETGALTIVDGGVIDAGSGTIDLDAGDDITLGRLVTTNTTGSAVALTSTAGGIVDGGDTGGGDIEAASGTLVIDAAAGVGSAGAIDTTVAILDIDNSTSGHIDINETDDVTINEIDQDGPGTVSLDAGGDITVALGQAGVSSTSGMVELDANGVESDITVNGRIYTDSGAIDVLADNDVVIGSGGVIISVNGAVKVQADVDGAVDSGGTDSGALTIEDGGVVDAGSGTIDLDAGDDITLGRLVTTNTTGSAITLTSVAGGIVDGGGTGGVDIEVAGGTLVIDAVTGVGSAGGIDTTVAIVDIDNSISGHIDINETDHVTIDNITQGAAGTVNLDAGGDITVASGQAGVSSTVGLVELDANGIESDIATNGTIYTDSGAINVLADNDVVIGSGGVISSVSGAVKVQADMDGAVDGGGTAIGALIMLDGGVIDAGSGTIDLDAGDGITLGRLVTSNTTGNAVTLTSTAGGIVDGGDTGGADIDAVSGALVMDAAKGVGSTGEIDTTVAILDIENSISGNIRISETDDVTIDRIDAGSGTVDLDAAGDITLGRLVTTNTTGSAIMLTSAAGGIVDGGDTGGVDVEAVGGTLVINAVTGVGSAGGIDTTVAILDIDNSTSGNIDINETDDVTINEISQDGTGNVNVVAGGDITIASDQPGVSGTSGSVGLDGNGVDADITIDGTIQTTSGIINVLADNDVAIGASGSIASGTGNVKIQADVDGAADSDGTAAGALMISDGGVINAGSGTIDLEAGNDITLGRLVSTNTTASAVTLSSTTGGIVDGGDTGGVDIETIGGTLVIDAVTGVGSAGAIDTAVAILGIDNSTSGNIDINETDDVTIDEIDAGSGTINIDAAGDITLGRLVTVNTTGNAVTLTSATGGIIDVGDIGGVDIEAIGGTLVIDAVTGVGSAGAIDTTVAILCIDNSTSGNIDINETDSVEIYRITQDAPGTVNLAADGDIAIVSDQAGVSSTSGLVELDANGVESDIVVYGTINTDSGAIYLLADDDVSIGSGGIISSVSGPVKVQADADSAEDTGGTATGALRISDGGVIDAGNGAIDLDAGDDIILGRLVTTSVTAGAITLTSTNGGVVDGGDTGGADIEAASGTLVIYSASGVGSAGGIDTTVMVMDIGNGTSGNIHINETDDVIVGGTGLQTLGDNGSIILVTQDGSVIIDSPVGAHGAGNLLIEANRVVHTADITLNADIVSGSGSISIIADDNVTQSDDADLITSTGTIDVEASTGSITMADNSRASTGDDTTGSIRYYAHGSIYIGGLHAGTGNVGITAETGSILDNGDTYKDIRADSAKLIAALGSVGTSDNPLETELAANTLSAQAGSGGVHITNDGDLTIGSVSVSVNRVESVDAITILSDTEQAGVSTTDNGDIMVQTVDGTLTVNSELVDSTGVDAGGGGDVTLAAGGTGNDVVLNNTVTSDTGQITIVGAQDVIQNSDITTSGTGTIGVTAQSGDILMTDGTTTSTTGTGGITYSAEDGIALSQIESGATVDMTAQTGSITDQLSGEAANISGTQATLVTGAGIGASDDIDTNIAVLDAQNTGTSGDIGITQIAEGGDVIVNRLEQTQPDGSGSISMSTEEGNITIAEGGAGVVSSGSGDVNLETFGTNTDIVINETISVGTGSTNIEAANDVTVNADINTEGANPVEVRAGNDVTENVAIAIDEGVMVKVKGEKATFVWTPTSGITLYYVTVERDGKVYDSAWVHGQTEWTPGYDLTWSQYDVVVQPWSSIGMGSSTGFPAVMVGQKPISQTSIGTLSTGGRHVSNLTFTTDTAKYRIDINRDYEVFASGWVEGVTVWLPDLVFETVQYEWLIQPWEPEAQGA